MNKPLNPGESATHTCSNCLKVFTPDKDSMSIMDAEKNETFYCSPACLKEFWSGKNKTKQVKESK